MSEFAILSAVLLLILTLFVALAERKFLAAAQRRMGPTLMGRNGAFQILADLIKLVTKEVYLVPRPATTGAPIFLTLLFTSQMLFSLNFVWGPTMFIVDGVDSMILYHLILILCSNMFFSVVGLLSQSSYAMIATVRGLVHVISLDVFITLLYSFLVLLVQSANFHDFVVMQSNYWHIIMFPPAASGFIIVLFLESKRAPFDHAETESEVVAGYATEYSGSMALIFILAEYIHLMVAALHFILFFCGGWLPFELFSLLPSYAAPYHDPSILLTAAAAWL